MDIKKDGEGNTKKLERGKREIVIKKERSDTERRM